jgi:hypothetical protein
MTIHCLKGCVPIGMVKNKVYSVVEVKWGYKYKAAIFVIQLSGRQKYLYKCNKRSFKKDESFNLNNGDPTQFVKVRLSEDVSI